MILSGIFEGHVFVYSSICLVNKLIMLTLLIGSLTSDGNDFLLVNAVIQK